LDKIIAIIHNRTIQMTQALLIEIGLEELPAIPLLKIVSNIEKSWRNILEEYKLSSDFEFVYTPRRLVLKHEAMALSQEDSTIELFGPPMVAAVKDGVPTKAAEGFARKCGVEFDLLGRGEKNGKEVLYFKKEEKGAQTVSLLQQMLEKWMNSMSFGKMMRWGARTDEFIRPIRWLQVRLGDTSVPVELFGVQSDIETYVHRMVTYDAVEVAKIDAYESILAEGAVMLQPKERESKILAEFDALEGEHNIIIERIPDI
jgi:glycyl-tRNA synthetase beta chain